MIIANESVDDSETIRDEIFINIIFIITLTVSQLRNLMEESMNNCSAWCMMNAIHKGCCGLELYHWEMHSYIIQKIFGMLRFAMALSSSQPSFWIIDNVIIKELL
jgi:hypothetical protein